MKIAVCGPMTLALLADVLDEQPVEPGYPFPGTARLIRDYIEVGHQVVAVTTSPGLARPSRYNGKNLQLIIVPSRTRSRARAATLWAAETAAIREAICSSQVEVAHAHWTYEFALGAMGAGVPTLVTVHDWAPVIARKNLHPYWWLRCLLQFRVLMRSHNLTAPSQYLADLVSKWYQRECSVVPNAIDLLVGDRSIERSSKTVLMLNNGFSRRKNVRTALKAWPYVMRRIPTARLVLAGADYQEGGPAHRWASKRGLQHGVEFKGPLGASELGPFYRSGQLFLHASLEESFGMVVLEAMLCETPVLVNIRATGVVEATGGFGAASDMRRPRTLAGKLVDVLESGPHSASELSLARQWALSFSRQRSASAYLSILMNLRS